MALSATATVEPSRLQELTRRELEHFVAAHPRSRELFHRARSVLIGGVPMHWMNKWASAFPLDPADGAFPIFGSRAKGSWVTDADGHDYADFCLGDTGAMTGHAPAVVGAVLAAAGDEGLTDMLPSEASVRAAELLSERFGLTHWQFTVSATDANRFAIRLARRMTGRQKILIFNHCYHGSVDESLATISTSGTVESRPYNLGPPVALEQTTRVVEFNDEKGVEDALAHGDVACVLTEPALTNVGIVLPAPGFHDRLRALTRRHGTLLILDETHTLSVGLGGMTRSLGLNPDIVTLGKAIAGGLPGGAYGIAGELATALEENSMISKALVEGIGVGGTLAGNALTARAIVATLSEVLTAAAYEKMIALSERWSQGVRDVIAEAELPWHVTQLGARAEYHFRSEPPVNGTDLAQAGDEDLERYLRLFLINRGMLTTPFHNMALMSPATRAEDIDRHTQVLRSALGELVDASA